MKCPNCSSQMFVTNESSGPKSQVTFFRCSICSSEHVSSEPKRQPAEMTLDSYFDTDQRSNNKPILMV